MRNQITAPKDSSSFPEFYSSMRVARFIGQNDAIGVIETPVVTKDISFCAVLLLKNRTNSDCLFMHLGPESVYRFSEELEKHAELFLNRPGEKVGVLIGRIGSELRKPIMEYLHRQGVHTLAPINIQTVHHIDVAYRPLTNEILCLAKNDDNVMIYTDEELSVPLPSASPSGGNPSFAESIQELSKLHNRLLHYLRLNNDDSSDDYLAEFEAFLDTPMIKAGGTLSSFIVSHFNHIAHGMFSLVIRSHEEMFKKPERLLKLFSLITQYIDKCKDFPEVEIFIHQSISIMRYILRQKAAGALIPDDLLLCFSEHTENMARDYPKQSGGLPLIRSLL